MADIRHQVGITAPGERVYQALATREGLSQWWTRDVRGEAAPEAGLEAAPEVGLEGGKATPYPEDMKISSRG